MSVETDPPIPSAEAPAERADGTRWLRQCEARKRLLDRFGDDAQVSAQEADAIRGEWRG